jgi:hypothetical protein
VEHYLFGKPASTFPDHALGRRWLEAANHESADRPHFSHNPQNVSHLGASVIKRLRAIHDKVGASAFFRIRHLLGKERREFFVGHAGPLEGTAALHLRRRRDHDHRIAAALRAGLKQ